MRRSLINFILIPALIWVTLTSANGQPLVQREDVLVLWNVTVIDGTGKRPRAPQTIVIDAGRIAGIYPTGKKKPSVGNLIDLTGHYVMPGLMDSHYHLNLGTRSQSEEDTL